MGTVSNFRSERGQRPSSLASGITVFPGDLVADKTLKRVLFYRTFKRFQGGHLNVWHHFQYVCASGTHVPYIRFSADSIFDASNPWTGQGLEMMPTDHVDVVPDIHVIGGLDWRLVDRSLWTESPVPVINLVQNVRHASPTDELSEFLPNKAIRICVDAAVKDAILATGRVRGPVFAIQSGTDVEIRADILPAQRDVDLLIVAIKRPAFGRRVADALGSGFNVHVVEELRPRPEILALMARSRVTLLLPTGNEGAHLPPLEAMALGSMVVCPDHAGTSYCRDGVNAFRPRYDEETVTTVIQKALTMTEVGRRPMIEAGFATARQLTLDAERRQFLEILGQAGELWRDAS